MLKTACIHPGIIAALSKCGHGDKVLIGSGNFPIQSQTGEQTQKICLNLQPDIPLSTEILRAINGLICIEKAEVIQPPQGENPEVFTQYREILGNMELKEYPREEFYERCREKEVLLAVESADTRSFSNILLTVGVVRR